ncbi:hypothetical protein TDB9533_02581 [Thalassocella blandensis]|nr:hypothetical protein TDB9533_02581 [Thalassocella blandensis]
MKNSSPTELGQNKPHKPSQDFIDALNQVFALFKLNYHNQFYKAYSNTEELNAAKRLWVDALRTFAPTTLLKAAKAIMQGSEFLPTLRTMIRHCEELDQEALPDAHSAYIEACRAPSPKANYHWSHLAIYYAGKACDWYFLQNNTEQTAFPVFKTEYERVCAQIRAGLILETPVKAALPQSSAKALDKESNQSRLAALKDSLDL